MNKYYNKKKDGFHSIKEYKRYQELLLLQRAGKICGLDRQVRFELIPPQYDGKKCVYRAVNYYADFVYWEDGKFIVEDVKGYKTKDYNIKAKLMYYMHHIKIRET